MTYNADIHHRHSIRRKDYDYSLAGAYFVTICAWQRECLFGEIVNGEMMVNDMGRIVVEEWERTDTVRKNVIIDEFVVMPNHFHGIIFLSDNVGSTKAGESPTSPYEDEIKYTVGATPVARPDAICNDGGYCSENRAPNLAAPTGPRSDSIGAIMAQFKSIVTKQINTFRNNPGCPVWQRNYYERIVRNENELSRAREYIVNNPMKWELDKENPVNCS